MQTILNYDCIGRKFTAAKNGKQFVIMGQHYHMGKRILSVMETARVSDPDYVPIEVDEKELQEKLDTGQIKLI
jgi:hypothetical protein